MYKLGLLAIGLVLMNFTSVLAQPAINEALRRLDSPSINASEPIDPSAVTVARLHYGGGGDWYWGSSAIPNLLNFVEENTNTTIDHTEQVVQINDENLFKYPFLYATGHGVIKFTPEERERLRTFLNHGGFLLINDSYGMDKGVRQEIAQLFPERELVELPFDHPIYHSYYDFPSGPPKIHEHDNKPARGYGIIIDNRVILYYVYESDIGDGWEDPQVHNDPPEKRDAALRMGTNILVYALTH